MHRIPECHKGDPCSEKHLRNRRRLLPVQSIRHGHHLTDGHGNHLGVPTARQKAHHPLPHDKVRVGARRDVDDLASALETQDLARAGGRGVVAGTLHQVGPIDRCGTYSHEYLAVSRGRVRHRPEMQHLWTARRVECDRLHGVTIWSDAGGCPPASMGTVGVEPTPGFPERCLRPPRLPFRHVPAAEEGYSSGMIRANPSSMATRRVAAATAGATFGLNTLGMM